jgi:hypothetical protein
LDPYIQEALLKAAKHGICIIAGATIAVLPLLMMKEVLSVPDRDTFCGHDSPLNVVRSLGASSYEQALCVSPQWET